MVDRLKAGQDAYEEDARRRPFNHDGTPRQTWHELSIDMRVSWMRNPTPRDWDNIERQEEIRFKNYSIVKNIPFNQRVLTAMKQKLNVEIGRLAYKQDVKTCPLYQDGSPRESWDKLCTLAKYSWVRDPFPRTYLKEINMNKNENEAIIKICDFLEEFVSMLYDNEYELSEGDFRRQIDKIREIISLKNC